MRSRVLNNLSSKSNLPHPSEEKLPRRIDPGRLASVLEEPKKLKTSHPWPNIPATCVCVLITILAVARAEEALSVISSGYCSGAGSGCAALHSGGPDKLLNTPHHATVCGGVLLYYFIPAGMPAHTPAHAMCYMQLCVPCAGEELNASYGAAVATALKHVSYVKLELFFKTFLVFEFALKLRPFSTTVVKLVRPDLGEGGEARHKHIDDRANCYKANKTVRAIRSLLWGRNSAPRDIGPFALYGVSGWGDKTAQGIVAPPALTPSHPSLPCPPLSPSPSRPSFYIASQIKRRVYCCLDYVEMWGQGRRSHPIDPRESPGDLNGWAPFLVVSGISSTILTE
ncbi:hypothetical protein J6590_012191 [Homalodisca vitripennis]|nr:hypothetical protein J6590_012191 [Homalodisca vitripennis]